mgnify:CR=1 FL=1|jgi:hypothetical protein
MTTNALERGKELDKQIKETTAALENIKKSEYSEIRFITPERTTGMTLTTEHLMFKAVIVADVEKKLKVLQDEFDAL